MPGDIIRPIVICVFRCGDRILVAEGYDPTKDQLFYRPVGGGIEFGESSEEALRREIREELGVEIAKPHLLGVLENRFTFDGATGHEIVFVYDAGFRDRRLYDLPSSHGTEDDGVPFKIVWFDLAADHAGSPPLYPDGLRELLNRESGSGGRP